MTKINRKARSADRQLSFKEKVFAVVRKIPAGKVLTYGEVARRAGSPRACRGVGSILRGNFNPTIPCHRVIRSDGTLGNYNRGGEKAKASILTSEGYKIHVHQKKTS